MNRKLDSLIGQKSCLEARQRFGINSINARSMVPEKGRERDIDKMIWAVWDMFH